jgi:hypothetical protein
MHQRENKTWYIRDTHSYFSPSSVSTGSASITASDIFKGDIIVWVDLMAAVARSPLLMEDGTNAPTETNDDRMMAAALERFMVRMWGLELLRVFLYR